MLTLDDDETDLALMALMALSNDTRVQAASHIRGFLLPRLRALVERIEQHKQDEAEEEADG
jgi:hypothetical protein